MNKSQISVDDFDVLANRELSWAGDNGIRLLEIESGRAIMELPYQRRSIRPGGSISGPHMMMLADACMFAVVLSRLGDAQLAVTTSFNINFLRKPRECNLRAEGRLIKLGKRLAVMEVAICDESEIVAHATGTYSLPAASSPSKRTD